MKTKKPKVVITYATRWSYFEWFILGLYELEKNKKIDFKIKIPFISYICSNKMTRRIGKFFKIIKTDSYNLYGYIVYPNKIKKKFCIDSADSPYLFNSKDLEEVDCYFKMQCPIDLDKDSFALNSKVSIPWLDHFHKNEDGKYFVANAKGERRECFNFKENKFKIRPLMVGPRCLSDKISYRQLKKGYNNYLKDRKENKIKKVMCYFGNTKGPIPATNVINPDFDSEANLMGFFSGKIFHPNEKRAKVAEIIASLGDDYDSRVIRDGNADSNQERNRNLIIPLKVFCSHISKFEYNFNVSGFRLSIPNRFIESFIVGTGIITDKLSVRWYLPFSKNEVIETVKMGYEDGEEIDWNQVKKDIKNVKTSNSKDIIASFEEKWAPKKIAEYIVKEVEKCK